MRSTAGHASVRIASFALSPAASAAIHDGVHDSVPMSPHIWFKNVMTTAIAVSIATRASNDAAARYARAARYSVAMNGSIISVKPSGPPVTKNQRYELCGWYSQAGNQLDRSGSGNS